MAPLPARPARGRTGVCGITNRPERWLRAKRGEVAESGAEVEGFVCCGIRYKWDNIWPISPVSRRFLG
jgi:hypothetical protein